jgi:hypothetical protein
VDVVSGIIFADGVALYPRPNINPEVPLVLYGSGYPGGKISMRPHSQRRLFDNRAISVVMCCEASELGKRISRFSGSFI